MIEVYLAGTGGMKPLPERFLTGLWTEHDGSAMLIDCGEGMQVALALCGRSLARLDTLLITHFHADHISGLPGLLLSAGNFAKTSPLHIYAPAGGREILRGLLRICPGLPYEVCLHEISGSGFFIRNGLEINFMPVRHKVDCYCYSLTEHRKPVFAPEKAKALGIPVEMWKRLHSGESVSINGKTFTSDDVTDGKRPPLKVTYITDTVYFDELCGFAAGSELLVSEGMYGDDEYRDKMREKGHMVFSQSAEIAVRSGSKQLWLTHYSPALKNPADYEESVKSIFPNTVVCRDGMNTIIK